MIAGTHCYALTFILFLLFWWVVVHYFWLQHLFFRRNRFFNFAEAQTFPPSKMSTSRAICSSNHRILGHCCTWNTFFLFSNSGQYIQCMGWSLPNNVSRKPLPACLYTPTYKMRTFDRSCLLNMHSYGQNRVDVSYNKLFAPAPSLDSNSAGHWTGAPGGPMTSPEN